MGKYEKEAAESETHPIFKYLKSLMKSRDIYELISEDHTRKIQITRSTQSAADPTKKCFDRIDVTVISHGGRIESFRQNFNFYYPQRNWQVRTDGLLSVKSALDLATHRVWTFHHTEINLYPANDEHIWLREELNDLLNLIKSSKPYHSYHGQTPTFSPLK